MGCVVLLREPCLSRSRLEAGEVFFSGPKWLPHVHLFGWFWRWLMRLECVRYYIYIYTHICVYISLSIYIYIYICLLVGGSAENGLTRKGGWHDWKPSSSSLCSNRAFRAYPLIEIRQTVPCRAIRGNSISLNSKQLTSTCTQVCVRTLYNHMRIYQHTDIPAYRHTYIPAYLHTYIPTCIPTYLHTYILTYVNTYTHTYMPTCIPTYLPTYTHP